LPDSLRILQRDIVGCTLCPRLVAHREHMAQVKRAAYRDQTYWGRPVPGFGDPNARLLLVGLAPGAHGANRTGRVFTGDRSGDFLYRALYETGFASQPTSTAIDDGLQLLDCYIASSARCAPPDNKPTPLEVAACRPYLEREVSLLNKVEVIVALGKLAFDNYLGILRRQGEPVSLKEHPFGHAAAYSFGSNRPSLIASYHPSQQNTSTGRLTAAMLHDIFVLAREQMQAEARKAAAPFR
jgi:uracil-DNA glycosylase